MTPNSARRILIVDDEPANRRLIQAILAPEGYSTAPAENGEQALRIIDQGGVDLVLLDVMMPGIDGIEVCRRIRGQGDRAFLPVILVTALTDQTSRTRGKEAGADDFLTKPVAEDELLARLRNLLLLQDYNRLNEAQRVRAETETRRWRLVSEVAGAVAMCRDYESLHRSISESLRRELPVDGSSFFEADGDQLYLRSALVGDGRPDARVTGKPMPWDRARWQPILAAARVLPVSAGASDGLPFAAPIIAGEPAASVMVPVVIGGGLQGIFVISHRSPFVDDELRLLEDLAPHFGNAIANVRSHLKSGELNLAKDRLTALLVHDLKNPLNVVKLNLVALADMRLEPSDRQEALDDARIAADRLLGMVVDLLDVGRAEDGRLPIDRQPVELATFLRAVLASYGANAKARNVTLSCRAEPDLRVDLDEKLFRRVLENLLNNAFRYVPRNGRIEVAVERQGDQVHFCICNNGPPIPASVGRHLFDKYGVVHESQGYANRGLGLYLCRLVVEGHGGTIGVRDGDLGGVCFRIQLPLQSATA